MIETVEALGRDYWLYVVYDCGTEPKRHIVRDPARAGGEPARVVEPHRLPAESILAAAAS